MLRALDLYCGLGGWSDGLAMEGFDVLGIDIATVPYDHPRILQDVRTLDGRRFRGLDLIVGSPPCRDFTIISDHGLRRDGRYYRWKDPKNPERGLELVRAFLRVVEEAEPRYWMMENVTGLMKYLDERPRMVVRLTRGKRRAFWGTFPAFLVPRDYSQKLHLEISGPLRAWERARIPLPMARALGRAVKEGGE